MKLSRAFTANPSSIESLPDHALDELYHSLPSEDPRCLAAYEEIQRRAEADHRHFAGCETRSCGEI
jgi:hypothetical protein